MYSNVKQSLRVVLIITITMLFINGCASVGKPFSTEPVSEIVIGKTTQKNIKSVFGDPWRVGLENGKKTWTYGFYQYSLINKTQTKDLVVRFDDQGLVSSYTFNSTNPDDI